ncbi:laminin subunit alpha-5-like isoform X2 [Lampetra planeri]
MTSMALSHLVPMLLLLLLLPALPSARAAGNEPSLLPPYFNVAERASASATATCGQDEEGRSREDTSCALSGSAALSGQGNLCEICSLDDPDSAHPVSNAIDGTERSWQSPPLSRGPHYNHVNVTLNLGQLFHVGHITVKFANSPRPSVWLLERSADFGHTYSPWQYFAPTEQECQRRFGVAADERVSRDDDVTCSTQHSGIVPLENGEVVVSLMGGRPGATDNSISPALRNFTTASHVRLRLLQTGTLPGHLLAKAHQDPTVTRRYFYSIKEISVGGRCMCHGHADSCRARNPANPYRLQCECRHGTCGDSCERCCPGMQQRPWSPSGPDGANACEPCNCHGHSDECVYDAEVDALRASMNASGGYSGGGLCLNCQHHTYGINCERCEPGYYRPTGVSRESPDACRPCACSGGNLASTCEDGSGHCHCAPGFRGDTCNRCVEGHGRYPACRPVETSVEMTPQRRLPNIPQRDQPSVEMTPQRRLPGMPPRAVEPSVEMTPQRRLPHAPHRDKEPSVEMTPQRRLPNKPHRVSECRGPGATSSHVDASSGRCRCHTGFEGAHCERCAGGYFGFPLCQMCQCSTVGTLPEVCDSTGRCLCRPEFDGESCDQCGPLRHSFPQCLGCACDPFGAVAEDCSGQGQCRCRPNFVGLRCEACARGFYAFPSCMPCDCDVRGSFSGECDAASGACSCRAGVSGRRCDACASGTYGFPACQVLYCDPAGSRSGSQSAQAGCRCRENVQGASCGVCKPLHWDLRESHPQGCRSCQCDREGALSGLAECTQETGQCPCKPHADSRTCGRCQEGFFALKASSYLGCQACGCDLGGSLGSGCDAGTGACRCKKGVSGRSCSSPRQGYYFPGLERLHVELEDGRTPTGDPPRFGFDGAEFANFSGRGYVKMSPLQEVVQVDVELGSSTLDLYVVALSYVSALDVPVTGRVTVTPRGPQGSAVQQEKAVVFAAATGGGGGAGMGPGRSITEAIVLRPGSWTLSVHMSFPSSASSPSSHSTSSPLLLLDHALLLPSAGALAESPVLRQAASDPCSVSPTAAQRAQLCLHYLYLPLEGFAGVRGIEGTYHGTGKHRSPSQGRKATHRHPVMADVSHKQQSLYLAVRAPEAGRYSLLLEYSSEAESESVQEARVSVRDAGGVQQSLKASVQILPCNYSFLCRAVALDPSGGVASYDLPEQAELHLTGSGLNFLLYKVHLIPVHKFSAALLEPRVHCVSRHGTYSPTGHECLASQFLFPATSVRLAPTRDSAEKPGGDASGAAAFGPRPRPRNPETLAEGSSAELALLEGEENQIRMIVRVEKSGRHVFLLHYFQPRQPSVHTKAALDASTWSWHGSFNATFCPHAYGCRGVVAFESQLGVDLREGQEVSITLTNPSGEALWLAYVLAVPESLFTPSVLREEPVDRSRDFVTLCGANGFSMRGDSVPEFCRAAASSLSALADDDGARRCGCDAAGSLPGPCRPLGGQCPCRPGVVGRSCDRCAAAHHGFPECRPCQCGGRLCDERTGECVCPPRTVRPDCTACQRLTFGFHPLAGCRPCECEDQGLAKAGCDRETGQCRCKPNVGGQRCEHCLPGFFGYPECRPCDCDAAGVSGAGCDAVTGQCLCKENVQGRRCDVCRVGTFDLGAENPKGCTACFCFGVTGECTSSKLRRETIANMSGWRLLMGSGGGEEESVQVKHDETARKAEAALSKRHMDAELEPYWAAPQAYLGDQLSSYGGELSYRVRASGGQDGHRTPPGDHQQPDLILRGSHMSLVHRAERQPVVGETFHGSVRLLEDGFQHGASGRPASREELAMVLQDLQALLLRGRTRPGPSRLTLSHVVMETASANASGPLARGVERCLCPASYRGGSCQECARGHYRDSRGSFLGRCLPCDCNGHSDECQDETGICIHCDHNTRGDHCELCREGCLPRDVQGDEPTSQCFPCPCPMTIRSNHFAIGCVQKPEGLECLCREGYEGKNCERCAPGYFGNPMVIGSECKACQCNGNAADDSGSPGVPGGSCDPVTGQCRQCRPHTAGPRCQDCEQGYYGDAVFAKNCTACRCDKCGMKGCDGRSGKCICKRGVMGHSCSTCEPGYYGFDSCKGCESCECAVAALGSQCDPRSGRCQCPPSVTGRRCELCQPGYWNYGPNGCQRCECTTGSCDPHTGRCSCKGGVSGEQCDQCSSPLEVPVLTADGTMQCDMCDGCVLTLLNDMDGAGKSLSDIKSILKGVSISTVTTVRLNKLNSSLLQAQKDLSRYKKSVTDQKKKVDVMETDTMDFQMDINALKEQVDSGARRVKALEASLERTHKRGGSVSKTVDSVVRFIQELISKAGAGPSGLPLPAEEFQRKLAEAESLVREMRNRNFDKMQDVADEEKRLAEDLMSRVRKEFSKPLKDLASRASVAHDNLEKYDRVLADLLESINAARNLTNHANTLNKANQAALDRNQQKVKDVRQAAGEANKSLSDAENVLGQAYQMIQLLEASRVEYEKLSAEVDGAKNLLRDKVEKMAEGAAQEPLVRRAEEHAKRLQELADNLKRLLKDIDQNEYIQKAILASKAYEDIIKALKETEEAADQALQAALKAEQDVQRENLPKKAADSKKASETLKKDIEDKQGTIKDLDKKLQGVKDTVNTAKDKLKALTDALQRAKQDLAMVNRGNIDEVLRKAKEDAQAAGDLAMSTENEANSILEEAKKLAEKIKSGAVDSQGFQLAFIEATKKVNDLTDLVPELLKKLAELEGKNISADVAGNLSNIREIIEAARHSASLAKVPMKFNGTSGVNVRLGSPLEELRPYTSVALYLLDADPARGDDTTGDDSRFLFYLGKKTDGGRRKRQADLGDYIGAFLERKKVVFVYNLGIGDTFLRFPEPDAIINPKAFTYVRFERIYEHAQAEFRQDKRIFKTMSVASRKDYLLDLDPANTVLYVGGAPAGAQLPAALSLPNFVGNLELAAINENITSLYNFEKTYFMNTVTDYPAKRYKDSPEVNPQTYYFDGTGYAEAPVDASGGRYNFDFNIRTSMDDGILLFMEKDNKFMCLSIYNGQLHFVFDFGAGPVVPKYSTVIKVHQKDFYAVQLNVLQLVSKVSLNVGPKSERLFFDVFSPEIQSLWSVVGNTAYIGGVPKGRIPDSIKQYLPVQTSYKGCMKALKVMTSAIALKQIPTSGIIYGCYDNFMVSRGADFTGTGYLSFQPEGFDATDFECGLTFKTTSPSGLLMGSVDRDLQISMVGAGIVQLKLGTITIRSASNGFNDGLPHYVKVTRQGNTVRMAVDNKYEPDKETARRRRASRQAPSQLYFLGGYVEASASRFNGCIANVYIRRPGEEHVEDLHNFVEKLDASLDGCVGSLLAAP